MYAKTVMRSICQRYRSEKKNETRELKQTTLNRYTYLDESDGKRYLRRYDALRLFVGYHKDRESALVQVKDITYNEGIVEYHLGLILEIINNNEDTLASGTFH